jgi:hypothetical protein
MAEQGENQDKEMGLNLIVNLALTNITVSDVIWHHGGGITAPKCPNDPKSCWYAWWLKNRNTFKVTAVPSRNYSNLPELRHLQAALIHSIAGDNRRRSEHAAIAAGCARAT